jgi:hypothetical protein
LTRKSGQVSKLKSKKKNEMILKKKMSFECMLLSILQIQLFQALPKGGGGHVPLAIVSYVSDKKR